MQQHAQRGLRLLFLILELDVFAEHAVHDFVSFFLATLLREPHRRFGNIVTANQQNNAGNNRRTEHPLPAIGHGIQEIAHERGHRSAQIPRRRHRAHRNTAVFLRRELGDKRSRNGIVGAYEHADEEARRDEFPRVAAKNAQNREEGNGNQVDYEHFLTADGIGQIAAGNGTHQNAQHNRRANGGRFGRGEVEHGSNLRKRHANKRKYVAVQK